MTAVRAIARWWLPALPPARVAWVRAVVAVMALLDVLVMPSSLVHRAGQDDGYRPVALARALALPAPSEPIVWSLLVVVVGAAGLVIWGGRSTAPAAAGWVGGLLLAVGYPWWCVYTMSFGYVAHDHMAIVVAALVLPSAGTCRYADRAPGRGDAGWALRMIQVATVATYTGSLLAKWVMTGGDLFRWGNSATLAWAFLRRPNPVNALLVDQVLILRTAQWGALLMELLAPLVFVLGGRGRAVLILSILGFHLGTLVLLGIHFLPTVVCWSAFVPWERLVDRWRARRGFREPAAATS